MSQKTTLNIYDISGRLVYAEQETYTNAGIQTYNINADNLRSGMYIAVLRAENRQHTTKIIIQ